MNPFRMNGGPLGRRTIALVAVLGLTPLSGLGPASVEAADGQTIKIENFSFVPDNLAVRVGTTVTWQNGDDIPHSVVFSDKSFRSKPLDTHDKATFTFANPGEMQYFCGLHPHMKGQITVLP